MENAFANYARSDAAFVSVLIENGEWARAQRHARLLLGSIECVMEKNGIAPEITIIHDSTPVRK